MQRYSRSTNITLPLTPLRAGIGNIYILYSDYPMVQMKVMEIPLNINNTLIYSLIFFSALSVTHHAVEVQLFYNFNSVGIELK